MRDKRFDNRAILRPNPAREIKYRFENTILISRSDASPANEHASSRSAENVTRSCLLICAYFSIALISICAMVWIAHSLASLSLVDIEAAAPKLRRRAVLKQLHAGKRTDQLPMILENWKLHPKRKIATLWMRIT
ncbi:hypothetical protein DSM3645_00120 [Blastopirellula marina DSM 3645]|uniref:Uncharacterized protein n=1 Tax=Blastopirellula marina DSM 3645 TaxID=314230 RepID=A3ZMA3_9BACT|nr:hypothetical protein DSM3645_00120 [Blastopirellula marina DSM 3645]